MSSNPSQEYLSRMGEFSSDEDFGEDEYVNMPEDENKIDYQLGMSQAEYASGLVRATYEGDDAEATIFHNDDGCNVTVEKMIWADGWHSGEKSQAMTLVLLKLRFVRESGGTITSASSELLLESMVQGEKNPQVVAWAQFHVPKPNNAVEVHKEESNSRGHGIELGASSQKVTTKWDKTKTASWVQTDTEIRQSALKFSAKGKNLGNPGQPNGVQWDFQQNQTEGKGISPEFLVAALFSRPTSGSYKASFKITAHTSGGYFKMFSLSGGDKVKWLVPESPGGKKRCFGDGKELIDSIDLNNLNNLRERPNSELFNQEWREMLSTGNTKPVLQKAKAEAAAANELMAQAEAKDNIFELPERHRNDARASGKAAAPPSVAPGSLLPSIPPAPPAEAPSLVPIPVVRSAKAATSTSAAVESVSAAAETCSLRDNKAATLPSLVLMPGVSHPAAAGGKTPPTASVLSYDGTSRMVELEARMGHQDGRVARLEERVAELERTLLRMTEALLQRPQPQV